MKKTLITSLLTIMWICNLQAQNEYRIRQELPNEVDSLHICSGWQVRIYQSDQASLTIVTPCQAFYDDANEPEVCTVEGRTLTLLENKALPKSTVIEINLAAPIVNLDIDENSILTTGRLVFSSKNHGVTIGNNAVVQGTSWHTDGGMHIGILDGASLHLDSLTAEKHLTIHQWGTANLECPVVLSSDTQIKRSKKATGTDYQSDSTINMTVKKRRGNYFHSINTFMINGGISAPIPLYMNNTSGSPYNRGENYRITLQMGFNRVYFTERFSFDPQLKLEIDWSRLLNSVTTNGNSLVFDNSVGAERPQQHLFGEHLGIDYSFRYTFGKENEQTGFRPFSLNFGLAVMYNLSGRLVTRTMGTDDHWHRTREKADVFNPWQLRAHVAIGGGPLTRATLGISYDLLPTFRSGIGADKLHTFGITLNF